LSAIGTGGDFDSAKARQVIGQELRVEQREPAEPQPGNERRERRF
jgi:hypothetical protein